MTTNRRRFLATGSAAVVALAAGCIADGTDPGSGGDDGNGESDDGDSESDGTDGSENETDDSENETDDSENETDDPDRTEDDGDSGTDGYVLADHETMTYSGNGETDARTLYSADEVRAAVEDDSLQEDAREEVDEFVDATDFDRAAIVLVRAMAPNLCYGVELEEIDADEEGLTVRARAVDESAADEACAQAIHTPTLLVRAVFEDEVPTDGTITVTDGWGDEHGFGYGQAHESNGSSRESESDSRKRDDGDRKSDECDGGSSAGGG